MEIWNIQVRQEKHLNQRLKRGYALFCWHVTRPTSELWYLPVDFSFVILVLKRCKIWKRPRNQVGQKWLEKGTPKSLSTHDLKVPWGSSPWLIIYFYSLWLTHPGSISYFCGNVSLQDDRVNFQFKCPLIFHSKQLGQLGHQHLLIFGASLKVIVYSKKTARASHLRNLRCFLTRTCLIALQQRHLLGGDDRGLLSFAPFGTPHLGGREESFPENGKVRKMGDIEKKKSLK